MADPPFWQRFEHDPRRPENAHLRAADRDRDLVSELLGSAYSDGRLDRDEFDERADRVTQAKTLGQLPELVGDLIATTSSAAVRTPGDRRQEAEYRYRRMRQQALVGFLMPTLICWVVWTATMFGGFPWPLFVTLGTGVRFFQLTFAKQDTIASLERHLVRKEQRRLEQRERREQRIQGYQRPPFPPQSAAPPRPLDPGPPPPTRPSGRTPPAPWQ